MIVHVFRYTLKFEFSFNLLIFDTQFVYLCLFWSYFLFVASVADIRSKEKQREKSTFIDYRHPINIGLAREANKRQMRRIHEIFDCRLTSINSNERNIDLSN